MSEVSNDNMNQMNDSSEVNSANHSSVGDITPGEMLKKAREQKDIALSTIGKQLKLDTTTLRHLEDNNFEKIGAPVFVKGHLRKYAEFVDVSPDDIMLAYYQTARAKEATPIITQTQPLTDARPKFAWLGKVLMGLVVLTLLSALLYAGYRGVTWWLSDAESTVGSNVPESNENIQQLSTPDQNIQSNELALPATNDAGALDVDTELDVEDSSAKDINGKEWAVESQAAETITTILVSSDTDSNQDSNEIKLRLVFNDDCWTVITNENGRRLFSGLGKKGLDREIELAGRTELIFGNADGVTLYLNNEVFPMPSGARSGNKAEFVLAPQS